MTTSPPKIGLQRLWPVAGLLTVVLAIACGALFSQDKESFLQSYLMGWLFWMLLALGCLGFTLLHHAIRGVWGLSVLRLFEAGGGPWMFAVLGVAFLPILFNLHSLYEWTHADFMASSEALRFKTWYLNEPFFFGRQAFYFAFWIALSWFLRSSSLQQDKTLNPRMAQVRMNVSAPMLVLYVISLTTAVTDWVMSLDPHWFSQIFGAWLMVGGGLTAIAFANLVLTQNHKSEPYRSVVNPGLTKDTGNMMFVFTLLWAYTSVSQLIIIWSGNLPEFNRYYVSRTQGGWDVLGVFLIVGQFLIPFIALLSPKLKAVPSMLGAMALWILLVRVFDLFWIVAPFFRTEGLEVHWGPDLASFAFVGFLWLAVFSNRLNQGELIPVHDSRLREAYQHA